MTVGTLHPLQFSLKQKLTDSKTSGHQNLSSDDSDAVFTVKIISSEKTLVSSKSSNEHVTTTTKEKWKSLSSANIICV